MMKKMGIFLFVVLLTACSTSPQETETPYTNESSSPIVTPSKIPSHSANEETSEPPSNKTWEEEFEETSEPSKTLEEEVEETAEQRKRKGDIDLSSMEVIGINRELLATINQIFEAINKNDEKSRHKLLYDPIYSDEFGNDGPYILAITKLELDNSRRDAVAEEYELYKVADEVDIVKITRKMLTTKLEESISTGDYIFIKTKTDQKWKVYRSQ
ncbi:hypothetical protein EBB07_23050 [Paenibacillaceae bacterium]|nr:hypothetical protein EBB07_23050 [Paenibacillaceae bacterium]